MHDSLIGTWSVDHRYGLGAQSDELLIFSPDGTGRLEILNFGLCSADFFHWEVTGPGRIVLNGFRRLGPELDANDKLIEASSDFIKAIDLPFTVQEERTPSGKTMPVLTINLGISNQYGLFRDFPTQWQEPS